MQTQAIATFLERQSDLQYVDDLLNLLDQHAVPVDVYVKAMRGIINDLMNSRNIGETSNSTIEQADGEDVKAFGSGLADDSATSRRRRKKGERIVADNARWLFVGVGSTLPILTVSRY